MWSTSGISSVSRHPSLFLWQNNTGWNKGSGHEAARVERQAVGAALSVSGRPGFSSREDQRCCCQTDCLTQPPVKWYLLSRREAYHSATSCVNIYLHAPARLMLSARGGHLWPIRLQCCKSEPLGIFRLNVFRKWAEVAKVKTQKRLCLSNLTPAGRATEHNPVPSSQNTSVLISLAVFPTQFCTRCSPPLPPCVS